MRERDNKKLEAEETQKINCHGNIKLREFQGNRCQLQGQRQGSGTWYQLYGVLTPAGNSRNCSVSSLVLLEPPMFVNTTFVIDHFNNIASTYREWYRRSGKRQCAWSVGNSNSPNIKQIILNPALSFLTQVEAVDATSTWN
jgi:hypothetical protein